MAEGKMTRAEARAQGLTRYLGEPCKYGHSGERYVSGDCIRCRLERNQRWADANKEKKAAGYAAWRERNREELKAKQAEYHAEWYEKNREKKLADNKEYLAANPEVGRKKTAKWREKNPEKAAAYAREWYSCPENRAVHHNRRRARKIEAGGTHTAADLKRILAAQGHRCPYCKADLRKVKRHLDHVMPLALGGSNGPENLAWLCAPCNLRKGARHPLDFAREQGLLV